MQVRMHYMFASVCVGGGQFPAYYALPLRLFFLQVPSSLRLLLDVTPAMCVCALIAWLHDFFSITLLYSNT